MSALNARKKFADFPILPLCSGFKGYNLSPKYSSTPKYSFKILRFQKSKIIFVK